MKLAELSDFTHAELSNFTHKELSMPADELIEKLKKDYRSLPVPTYEKLRIIAESVSRKYENDNDPKKRSLAQKLKGLLTRDNIITAITIVNILTGQQNAEPNYTFNAQNQTNYTQQYKNTDIDINIEYSPTIVNNYYYADTEADASKERECLSTPTPSESAEPPVNSSD